MRVNEREHSEKVYAVWCMVKVYGEGVCVMEVMRSGS